MPNVYTTWSLPGGLEQDHRERYKVTHISVSCHDVIARRAAVHEVTDPRDLHSAYQSIVWSDKVITAPVSSSSYTWNYPITAKIGGDITGTHNAELLCCTRMQGNYRQGQKVNIFGFPKDSELTGKWRRAITTFPTPSLHSKPCRCAKDTSSWRTSDRKYPILMKQLALNLLPNCKGLNSLMEQLLHFYLAVHHASSPQITIGNRQKSRGK